MYVCFGCDAESRALGLLLAQLGTSSSVLQDLLSQFAIPLYAQNTIPVNPSHAAQPGAPCTDHTPCCATLCAACPSLSTTSSCPESPPNQTLTRVQCHTGCGCCLNSRACTHSSVAGADHHDRVRPE
jgi:hypothetical protein